MGVGLYAALGAAVMQAPLARASIPIGLCVSLAGGRGLSPTPDRVGVGLCVAFDAAVNWALLARGRYPHGALYSITPGVRFTG